MGCKGKGKGKGKGKRWLALGLLLAGCGATAQDACSPEALEATTVACEIAIEAAPSEAAARAEYVACLASIHQWRERCA